MSPADVVAQPIFDPSGPEHEAAIGLGSNLGSSLATLQQAWRDLHECPGVIPLVLSNPYQTQPVGMDSIHWFVNAAALVRTRFAPSVLLRLLHAIEVRHGRVRPSNTLGCQDRSLDLDLLFYDDLIVDTGQLILPHPRMDQRLFVLAPLSEIAADRVHPGRGRSIGALLADFRKSDSNQAVRRIDWE